MSAETKLILNDDEKRIADRLTDIARTPLRNLVVVLASAEVHADLNLPTGCWPAIARARLVAQLLDSCLPDVGHIEPDQRMAVIAGLRLERLVGLTVAEPKATPLMLGAWGAEAGFFPRLIQIDELELVSAPRKGYRRSAAGDTEPRRQVRNYWRRGRNRLAREIHNEVSRRTQHGTWDLLDLSEERDWVTVRPAEPEGQPRPPSGWTYLLDDRRSEPDPRILLDGGRMGPAEVLSGLAVDRNVVIDGVARTITDVVAWIDRQRGRTLLLSGDAGDGTSTLALQTAIEGLQAGQVFLAWVGEGPPTFAALEQWRRRAVPTGEAGSTYVAVAELPVYTDSVARQQLQLALANQSPVSSGLVVLIVGRHGDLAQLGRRLPHTEQVLLRPLDVEQRGGLADRLVHALEALRSQGWSDEELEERYPNLQSFSRLDDHGRTAVLEAEAGPLIVGLLRAVYGREMWRRLVEELAALPDQADRRAYRLVCLTSAAGQGISGEHLASLALGADIEARAQRDPWRRDRNGYHRARHPRIAQVVLEMAPRETGTIRSLCNSVAQHADEREYSDLLRSVILTLGEWQPLVKTSRNDLKNDVLREVRRALRNQPGFRDRLIAHASGSYWRCISWADVLHRLIPDESHVAELLPIIDMAIDLAAVGRAAGDCPSDEAAEYFQIKLDRERRRLLRDVCYEDDVEDVVVAGSFIDNPLASVATYVETFWWSSGALYDRRADELDDDEVPDALMLYSAMCRSYELMRRAASDGCPVSNRPHIDERWGTLLTRYIYRQLPAHVDQVLREAWLTSRELGTTNPWYVESRARLHLPPYAASAPAPHDPLLGQLLDDLELALDSQPHAASALYLFALAAGIAGRPANMIRARVLAASQEPTSHHLVHLTQALMADTDDEALEHLEAALERCEQAFRGLDEGDARAHFERIEADWRRALSEVDRRHSVQSKQHRARFEHARKQYR